MATCSECRHKRRKFAQKASAGQKALERRLEEENRSLRTKLDDQKKQLTEARQWQNEAERLSQLVTRHRFEIEHLQGQLLMNGPQPLMHRTPVRPPVPMGKFERAEAALAAARVIQVPAYPSQTLPTVQDCYAAYASQSLPNDPGSETHAAGYLQFYQQHTRNQQVAKPNAPYADQQLSSNLAIEPIPLPKHSRTDSRAQIPANHKRVKLEGAHISQPLKVHEPWNFPDNHAQLQLLQPTTIVCEGAGSAADDEGTLLDAACDAFDEINSRAINYDFCSPKQLACSH